MSALWVFGTNVPYLVRVSCGYLALTFPIWCGCPVGIWHYDSLYGEGALWVFGTIGSLFGVGALWVFGTNVPYLV